MIFYFICNLPFSLTQQWVHECSSHFQKKIQNIQKQRVEVGEKVGKRIVEVSQTHLAENDSPNKK